MWAQVFEWERVCNQRGLDRSDADCRVTEPSVTNSNGDSGLPLLCGRAQVGFLLYGWGNPPGYQLVMQLGADQGF